MYRNQKLDNLLQINRELEEVVIVSRVMEEMQKEELIEVAERLLKLKKLSYEEIAEIVKLTVEEVKTLDEKECI